MNYSKPDSECLGNYNFDNIAQYAHQHFIEGCSLLELFQRAKSNRQRQEATLVSYMDYKDKKIENLELTCQYKEQCKATNCQLIIKEKIERYLDS